MADVFRALDDETRRVILDELAVKDAQTLFELCAALAMKHGISSTRQAISQHLAVLEDVGLVTSERIGRTKIHHFHGDPLSQIYMRWPFDPKGEES